ncbi:MAG TPA: TonB-dependent receptor [Candidatus Saccharimonadales bacterium]|nr:TonB-dependent receptor [Candidatus Saccharimonadales bacterium]
MRAFRLVVFCFFLLVISISASALDLSVRVVDPSSSAVPAARVSVFSADGKVLGVSTSSGAGVAVFKNLSGSVRVRVDARGFGPLEITTTAPSEITAHLNVATAEQTVVVTADATPLQAEKSGAAVSTLGTETLGVLNLPELSDNFRFIPGVYVSDGGQRGGLTTMFVRGGESNYNKVIVDGVPVNEDGGTINAGVIPAYQVDRVEMVRGAVSTLYGSDAMTSVTQLWSATGRTRTPQLKFGSEGGTFSTAHGFASLSGVVRQLDYNAFGDQFQTDGQGVNDSYENAMQGANLGLKLSGSSALRLRLRHANSRTGVQSDWFYPYPGVTSIPPATYQYARQNDFLGSLELTFSPVQNWQNTITGFEYNHILKNFDPGLDLARPSNSAFDSRDHFNRAGLDYQSEITERNWSRTIAGFHFEDENGYISSTYSSFGFPGSSFTHGLRRNSALFGEQVIDWKRLTIQGGLRWEHNESFGDKAVPRISASYLLHSGSGLLSGTRLRGGFSEGIKEPSFEQSFGIAGTYVTLPNPNLKPEQVRTLEAGFVQNLFDRRWSVSAMYFNNRFTNQVEYTFNSSNFTSQYINLNRSLAHGAEVEVHGRLSHSISLGGSYTYTSTQALSAPSCPTGGGCSSTGQSFIRRPKQLGSLLTTYTGKHWGASLAGSFVGRRTDFDFENFPIPTLTLPGYARLDASGYYNINRHVAAFATVQNLLNRRYEEVAGYPAYKANFRAGMRFQFGGE